MGRKRKKPADKRSSYIKIMMTETERLEIERAASLAGNDTSAWMRMKILELIRKETKK